MRLLVESTPYGKLSFVLDTNAGSKFVGAAEDLVSLALKVEALNVEESKVTVLELKAKRLQETVQ